MVMTKPISTPAAPPLAKKIGQKFPGLSKSEQAVATYLTTHLRELPFLTAAKIATNAGVSQMTVSRCLRSIGYAGLEDVKRELNRSFHQMPWLIGDRYRQFVASGSADKLSNNLDAEIQSLISVYELARSPEFHNAAKMVANSDQVFVAGFQTVRGVAADFAQRLEYVRDNVRLLTGENSTYSEAFAPPSEKCVLILIDIRRYSRQIRLLAAQARDGGIPTIVVSDATCSWARGFTRNVFLVKCDIGTFWDSNAPLASFLNILGEKVIDLLGGKVGERIARMTRLQDRFGSFED
jgi:DNA-binding MurR/RpiR family transcriptional regulator